MTLEQIKQAFEAAHEDFRAMTAKGEQHMISEEGQEIARRYFALGEQYHAAFKEQAKGKS